MENYFSFETMIRLAYYIGSFIVNGQTQKERTEIVYKKLESMRNMTQQKRVMLVISLSGIKVCNDTGETVRMAHALRRISYATSDPDFCQFSFLAREPKGQASVQYCHTFITDTPALAEELNDIVGEAFRLAYSKQKQVTRGSVTKTSSFNEIIERQLNRHKSSETENTIEEKNDESNTRKNNTSDTGKELDRYNLLAGDKTKKNSSKSSSKPTCSKNIPNNFFILPKDEIDKSSPVLDQSDYLFLNKSVQKDPRFSKDAANKPLPDLPRCIHVNNQAVSSRSERNNYDETSDPATEESVEESLNDDPTPPWIYPNRKTKSAFKPKTPKKPALEPHQSIFPRNDLISSNRSSSEHDADIKSIHFSKIDDYIPDQYSCKEFAPLPPQRMDSLPSYDLAERGCAEGESVVGTGPIVPTTKCHPITDTSTLYLGSTSGSSEKSANRDVIKDTVKWPEKWYQPDIPREVALDLLSQGETGSFVVRDSSSHSGSYALSVRMNKTDNVDSVVHYLIQRTPTGFKIKGLDKEWPTMKSLVTHLTIMPEMLPCPLLLVSTKRHTTTTSNPAFCPTDAPPKSKNFQDDFGEPETDDDDDLDYQHLSDFSSMMADLCMM